MRIPDIYKRRLLSSWGYHALDTLHWYPLLQMIIHPENDAPESAPNISNNDVPTFSSTPPENHHHLASPPSSQTPLHKSNSSHGRDDAAPFPSTPLTLRAESLPRGRYITHPQALSPPQRKHNHSERGIDVNMTIL